MFRILIYPLNTAIILTLSLFFSLLNFSYFYEQPNDKGILYLLIIVLMYFSLGVISFGLPKPKVENYSGNEKLYFYLLGTSLMGFVVEFIVCGIPLLIEGGRDNYSGLPVLHVIFYSMLVCSVAFAALYANIKGLLGCLACLFVIAILLLSRQMIMMASIMTVASLALRYDISARSVIKVLCYGLLLILVFGILGNLRQQLSGDYVDDYIYMVGGANANGALLWEPFYWVWLYIASPIYNLLLNLNDYDSFGKACNFAISFGSCRGDFISNVLVPNTMVKYMGLENFDIDLVMQHLNVGTGYAVAARLLGIVGVILLVFAQLLLFLVGLLITPGHIRAAFIVYFSTLSFFMLFDNLFIKGEFFFGFIVIFITGYLTRPPKNDISPVV
ncbi:hypothetical protein ACMGGS_20845 [Superficieibacter sp. BNK-5]|uniref:hypothetical protein n=1 Tax=Superficieibacter sp. BNK-5 TaxID=3376142 RepID=UPI0039BFEDC6